VADAVGLWDFNAGEAVLQSLGSREVGVVKVVHVALGEQTQWARVASSGISACQARKMGTERRSVYVHGGKRR